MSLLSHPMLRLRSAVLVGAVVSLALGARAQVTSLTAKSSLFESVYYNGSFLGDTYDAGNASLDPTKQSGLNGSASNWDLVGDSTRSLLQVSLGATDTYFRVRLADYKASGNSGSVIVLMNDGTTSYGVGVKLGSSSNGVFYLTPQAGTTLTAGFQYNTPIQMTGGTFAYQTVASIDSGSTSISANDAFITFRVLNSDLTANNAPFSLSPTTTSFTAFTNNNSVWNTNINADYISFGGTGATTDPLTFGKGPEPATWASTGAMLAFGGLIWWRRRKARLAA